MNDRQNERDDVCLVPTCGDRRTDRPAGDSCHRGEGNARGCAAAALVDGAMPCREIQGQRGRVLVTARDDTFRQGVVQSLESHGFTVKSASDGFKALGKMEVFRPDVVLSEWRLPGMDGLKLLTCARDLAPQALFVLTDDNDSAERAMIAIRSGASDFVAKSAPVEVIVGAVDRAAVRSRAEWHGDLSNPRQPSQALDAILGEHALTTTLRALVRQIAPSRANVLIEGESGTGKGLLARAIHEASKRFSGPFVRLSCAELTETLLESELFGHEKGAFTGAIARHEGRFRQAHGGTLFLDEVSEIPLSTQVKLLRFVQDRAFERVGGSETIRVDVRIISATNRRLERCVQEGTFRLDLYYRLNVVPLRVAALRERGSDIALLAGHFLRRFAEENGRAIDGYSDGAMQSLMAHTWPGNVRELENVVERAVVLCSTRRIEVENLPLMMQATASESPQVPGSTLRDLERWAILTTLAACGGSTSHAGRILGISARKIQYRLREYREPASRPSLGVGGSLPPPSRPSLGVGGSLPPPSRPSLGVGEAFRPHPGLPPVSGEGGEHGGER